MSDLYASLQVPQLKEDTLPAERGTRFVAALLDGRP